ncbi:MAG: response regulator transcription factor [Candidatus Brocadiaceae bacterium]|nr:response regulator transcription factor [Candidatus Brocadiaceae bacterium]
MKKILIADDHPIIREGLKQILNGYGDAITIDSIDTCLGVLNTLRQNTYDLLLLDINMPDKMGLDILEELKDNYPALPVLILSIYPEEQYAISALKLGADGYLVKKTAPNELLKAIEQVSRGEKYVSSSLAKRLAQYVEADKRIMPHERLSGREYQVMRMIVSGKSLTEIAENLLLSVKTVSTYKVRILEKMGMSNNIELVRYAIGHGLID